MYRQKESLLIEGTASYDILMLCKSFYWKRIVLFIDVFFIMICIDTLCIIARK